jgi:hypothetical protein
VATGRNRPILLKKSDCPKRSNIDGRKHLFCTLLREIRVLNLLPKTQISISGAYFSAVESEAEFFNRIGQKQPFARARFEPIATPLTDIQI